VSTPVHYSWVRVTLLSLCLLVFGAEPSLQCGCRGRLVLMLATAKEQTKSASEDGRNVKAGEKPEQVWGFIATKPRLIYK
jgi:hypothetical protein